MHFTETLLLYKRFEAIYTAFLLPFHIVVCPTHPLFF
jgi:hypothetical protein